VTKKKNTTNWPSHKPEEPPKVDQRQFNPGRPPLSDAEETVKISAKVTASQKAEFLAAGGAEWLRTTLSRRMARSA